MSTYVAVLGAFSKEKVEHSLSIAENALRKIMPASKNEVGAKRVLLPSVGGGWTTIASKESATAPLIQEAHADDLSVLVHGRISSASAPAKRALAAYRKGGVDAVRALDGAFLVIIVDHHSKTVTLCSDLIGHMAAHYLIYERTLFISPHDGGLVAASDCQLSIDSTSALSMALFDWSIGGRPMLSDVKATSSLCWYTWHDGRMVEHPADPFPERTARTREGHDRIDTDISAALEETIAHLVTETRDVCDLADQITISLTGGIDSRLLLALVRASGTRTPIAAVTGGTPWSMDVVLAKALSKIVDIPHERVPHEEPDIAGFISEAERYAFHFNGDTSAKRALKQPGVTPGEIRLTGGAGEIYRGYYYGLTGGNAAMQPPDITDRVWQKAIKRRTDLVNVADKTMLDVVKQRLLDTLSGFAAFASSSHDFLDCFYLFERYGRWGALVTRRVWREIRSPLACPSAIRAAYQMPSPIGDHCNIHESCISRFLPRAAHWLPINLRQVLPLGKHVLKKPLATAGAMIDRTLRRADAAAGVSREVALAGPLFDVIEDNLSKSDGVTTSVFGANGVTTLLECFRQTPLPLHEPISCLLSAEIWLRQLRRAKTLASAKV